MRRIRPRSVYDVIALISLFLVVGGGTALAAFVVSSNSQVGPNTISGHKPPTGDHSNIITGSVNGTDLAANSVNSPKVTNGSLLGSDLHANTITGSNLNATSVSNALKLQSASAYAQPGDTKVFYNTGAFKLTGACNDFGGGTFNAVIQLSAGAGTPAFASINGSGSRFVGDNPNFVALGNPVSSGSTNVKEGEFSAASAEFTNHLSGHVLAVADGDPSDFGGTPTCEFTFEGIGS